jgi:hypothetical protein
VPPDRMVLTCAVTEKASCSLFNDVLTASESVASNGRVITESLWFASCCVFDNRVNWAASTR